MRRMRRIKPIVNFKLAPISLEGLITNLQLRRPRELLLFKLLEVSSRHSVHDAHAELNNIGKVKQLQLKYNWLCVVIIARYLRDLRSRY